MTTQVETRVLAAKLEQLRDQERARRALQGPSEEAEEGGMLRPPVALEVVAALEAAHGIVLPVDYREFVTQLGDGGSGPPYYGLYGVEEAFESTRKGIYTLADPFIPPQSTDETVDEEAPGILLVGYQGCAFYDGLVVSGSEAGTMWTFVEVRPGWIPVADPAITLLGERGKPYVWKDDYSEWYNALLSPLNRANRMSFSRYIESWLEGRLAPPVSSGTA